MYAVFIPFHVVHKNWIHFSSVYKIWPPFLGGGGAFGFIYLFKKLHYFLYSTFYLQFKPDRSGSHLVFSKYILCNNTTSVIRFGQVRERDFCSFLKFCLNNLEEQRKLFFFFSSCCTGRTVWYRRKTKLTMWNWKSHFVTKRNTVKSFSDIISSTDN